MKIFLLKHGSWLIILSAILFIGCSDNLDTAYQNNDAQDYIIEIADPNFATMMQEIQMNRSDFIGRTVRYEGLFLSSRWNDEILYFVARLEGGCCGIHGFEVYLNDISRFDDETWVEVTGVLEEISSGGHYFLRLNVIELVEI